jgi:peptidylprolyl isomerase
MSRKLFTLAAVAVSAVSALAVAQTTPPPGPPPPPLAPPTAADYRTPDPQDILVIDTNKGRILVEMVPAVAPNHVVRVRTLARQGFYDGKTFFRVIDGFMAQTGDPNNDGTGSSGDPDLDPEFLFRRGAAGPMTVIADGAVNATGFVGPLPVRSQNSMLMAMTNDQKVSAWALYCPGVAAMARGGAPDSANSQFFLMRDDYPSLEQKYTAWGRVISGLSVVRAIKTGEPVAEPRDRMERVRILADLPAQERPSVRVIDPAGPWFKARVDRLRATDGEDFSPCDIEIPAEIK